MKICPKCQLKHTKSGTFCSRSCANSRGPRTEDFKEKVRKKLKGKPSKIRERVEKPCYICAKPITLTILESKRNITCKSKKCILEANRLNGRKSASKRNLRSRDEIKLFNLCSLHFNNILANEPIANGWDADILLKDYKLAILWNGPWHYREMGLSNHSLNQVINRDCIKIHEFEKLNWEVLIYQDNKWTPKEAFIDILIKIKQMVGSSPRYCP